MFPPFSVFGMIPRVVLISCKAFLDIVLILKSLYKYNISVSSAKGENVNVDKVLNVLRVLGILENLNYLIPEQELVPTEMVDIGRNRKRVTGKRKKNEKKTWTWGDEK